MGRYFEICKFASSWLPLYILLVTSFKPRKNFHINFQLNFISNFQISLDYVSGNCKICTLKVNLELVFNFQQFSEYFFKTFARECLMTCDSRNVIRNIYMVMFTVRLRFRNWRIHLEYNFVQIKKGIYDSFSKIVL